MMNGLKFRHLLTMKQWHAWSGIKLKCIKLYRRGVIRPFLWRKLCWILGNNYENLRGRNKIISILILYFVPRSRGRQLHTYKDYCRTLLKCFFCFAQLDRDKKTVIACCVSPQPQKRMFQPTRGSRPLTCYFYREMDLKQSAQLFCVHIVVKLVQ